MTNPEIQGLLLQTIDLNPGIREEVLLAQVKAMVVSEDSAKVTVNLVEGLFYAGLLSVKLTEDKESRAFWCRA